MTGDRRPPVVTGAGILTAIAADLPGFTEAIRAGRSGIAFADRPGEPAALAAELRGFDFPAALEALAAGAARAARDDPAGPGEAGEQGLDVALNGALDRARRIARRAPLSVQASVVVALEAWARAGLHRSPVAPDRVSIVVAGNNLAGRYGEEMSRRFDQAPGFVRPTYALQHQDSNHVGVVSAVLPIAGEGNTVGAASASGGVAIAQAARTIAADAADVCVVIGALSDLGAVQRTSYLNLGAMAAGRPDRPAAAQSRPFDAGRAGFVAGQGAACVILESAASARRREAVPLAALLGQAVRLDGNHSADPSRSGETGVMAAALASAGLSAGRVDYVNAHGTGSPLGDDTEAAALAEVFDGHTGRVWVNATKALTGHCLSSAGVVEAVATIEQLRGGFVHPNPHLDHPIRALRFAGKTAAAAGLEVGLSNSFGFGGFNACLVFGRVSW